MHISSKNRRSSRSLTARFCALSLLILGFWLPLSLSAAVLAETNFNDGTLQGWAGEGVRDPGLQLSQPGPSGDLNDRFLRFVDRASVGGIPGLRVFAPQAFRGDYLQTARRCGSLEFDIRVFDDQTGQLNVRLFFDQDSDGFDLGAPPEVRAFFQLAMPIDETSGWQHVKVPLALLDANGNLPNNSSGAWQMATGSTASQWNTLLSRVDIVHFPMEINNGTFEDIGIDNVQLLTGECPCPSGPPSTRRAGRADDFAAPQDTALRGSELEGAFPTAVWTGFDEPGVNRIFGQTFSNLPVGIAAAELEIRLRPNGELVNNDALNIGLNPNGSFAFASRISALPGANGTWGTASNGPTVFTLDLANLPNGGSLLAKLNTNRRLDVLVQDDTAVDWVNLRFWTCPARDILGGLPYNPLVNTASLPNLSGDLTYNPVDEDGPFGVVVDLGEGDGFCMVVAQVCMEDEDSALDLAVNGHVEELDMTAMALLGLQQSPDGIILDVSFDEPFDQGISVQIWNNGEFVTGHGPPLDNGPIVQIPATTCFREFDFLDGTCYRLLLATPVDVTILQGGPTETGDEIRICGDIGLGEGRQLRVSNFAFEARNLPPITVTGGDLQQFGLLQSATGVALLESSTDSLTVANIGPSGDDGVAIRTSGSDSFDAEWERLDVGSLPSGARLETVFRTGEGNDPPAVLGKLTGVKGDDGIELSADFTSTGATVQTVEMLLDGEVVDRLDGQLAELNFRELVLPSRFQTDVHYTDLRHTPADQEGPPGCDPETRLPGDPPCLFAGFTFREVFPFVGFASGLPLFADEIRVVPEDPNPVSAGAAVVEITGRDLGELHFRSAKAGPATCIESPTILCLNEGRFQVGVHWRTAQGTSGSGQAVPLTSDTGYFWFFNQDNVEMVIKILDACAFADRFWVFAGGLTNVEVDITVTDTLTGDAKIYRNPLRTPFQPIQDTNAFATCDAGGGAGTLPLTASQVAATAAASEGAEVARVADPRRARLSEGAEELLPFPAAATELLLNDNRFRVELEWSTPQGNSGAGQAVPLTSDTGYFWFFAEDNVEMVIKVLDACAFADRFWVFAGGLTNVEVDITVTDTLTGDAKIYRNPLRTPFQPIQDTNAFDTCP